MLNDGIIISACFVIKHRHSKVHHSIQSGISQCLSSLQGLYVVTIYNQLHKFYSFKIETGSDSIDEYGSLSNTVHHNSIRLICILLMVVCNKKLGHFKRWVWHPRYGEFLALLGQSGAYQLDYKRLLKKDAGAYNP